MNLLARINPAVVPTWYTAQSELQILRERILQAMLLTFTLLGLPVIVLISRSYLESGSYIFPALYFGFYLLFVLMLLFRNIPYAIRGYTLVAIFYLMAVSELFESGEPGEVRMFLVAFVALTVVLFSYRSVIFAIALGLATIIVMAKTGLTGDWVNSSAVFLLISVTISGSIAMIIAGLEASLLRQASLARNLEHERVSLEDRVQNRMDVMNQRIGKLRTAAAVTRAISALQTPEQLLQQAADQIQAQLELYYVGIFLLDPNREYAVLKAGTGEAGKQMVVEGHRLPVRGNSMIGWAIANRLPRVAHNVDSEDVRFNNPLLPLTRSELALPIIQHKQVLGAVSFQSEKVNAFDEHDIALLQSMVESLAILEENNQQYQETSRSLEEIRALNQAYLQRAWAEAAESYGGLTYAYDNPQLAGSATVGKGITAGKTIQVPLVIRDEVIGYLDLEMDQEALSDEERSFVENVTAQTAIALENARLLQEMERRAIQEQKLNEMAARFSRAFSIEEILRAAAQEFGQLPTVGEVSIQVRPVESKKNSGNGKEPAV